MSLQLSIEEPTASSKGTGRVRLDYLDGLRGIAALYVVVHHAAVGIPTVIGDSAPGWMRALLKPLAYGHFAVALFIVLSGYCLMLPVVRSTDKRLKGGVASYIRRRAQRILPPYYAALLVSAALIWFDLLQPQVPHLTWYGNDLSASAILTHLALIHNLSAAWCFKLDVPLWTVATEWQIYFIFALILLPIWRRFGIGPTVLASFALGLAPHYLIPGGRYLDQARFWYIGLFALGMMGAVINFSDDPRFIAWRKNVPWTALSVMFGASMVAAAVLMHGFWTTHAWLIDPWAGLASACLLIGSTNVLILNQERTPFLRFMEARLTERLGAFSYSLYLIHYPILLTFTLFTHRFVHTGPGNIALSLLIGAPIAVAGAYVFYHSFERPFVSR